MSASQKAINNVISAWVVEGCSPEYHRRMKAHLRLNWPVLAHALDQLTKEHLTNGTNNQG